VNFLRALGARQITAEIKVNRKLRALLCASILAVAAFALTANRTRAANACGDSDQGRACTQSGHFWTQVPLTHSQCGYTFTGANVTTAILCQCFICYQPSITDCGTVGGTWIFMPPLPGTLNPLGFPYCKLPNGQPQITWPGGPHIGNGVGGNGGIDCSQYGLVSDGSGGCTTQGNTGDPGGYCLDHPTECFLYHSFVFTNLPFEENCLDLMNEEDPPLLPLCGPGIIMAPGGGGKACLSRGGSIELDFPARRLICWSRTNAGAPPARLEVPPYDEKAKGVLENCRAKGHSVTLQDGAFACIETPSEVIQDIAQHFASMPQLDCKPPMVPVKNRMVCICPEGTKLRGNECVQPIDCRAPLVPNAAGTECVCKSGLVLRGGKCVEPIVCKDPATLNSAGTGCNCPGRMISKGNTCVEPEHNPRIDNPTGIPGFHGRGGEGGGPRGGGGNQGMPGRQ
jgi:hypothetical protein